MADSSSCVPCSFDYTKKYVPAPLSSFKAAPLPPCKEGSLLYPLMAYPTISNARTSACAMKFKEDMAIAWFNASTPINVGLACDLKRAQAIRNQEPPKVIRYQRPSPFTNDPLINPFLAAQARSARPILSTPTLLPKPAQSTCINPLIFADNSSGRLQCVGDEEQRMKRMISGDAPINTMALYRDPAFLRANGFKPIDIMGTKTWLKVDDTNSDGLGYVGMGAGIEGFAPSKSKMIRQSRKK